MYGIFENLEHKLYFFIIRKINPVYHLIVNTLSRLIGLQRQKWIAILNYNMILIDELRVGFDGILISEKVFSDKTAESTVSHLPHAFLNMFDSEHIIQKC
jgi:hypothetical protein